MDPKCARHLSTKMIRFSLSILTGSRSVSLTYLGYSCVKFEINGLNVYVDPFFRDPGENSKKLPKGDLVLFSHGHFDHGVQSAAELYQAWQCQFIAPKKLINWMARKFRKKILPSALLPLNHHERIKIGDLEILAVPTTIRSTGWAKH